MSCEKETLHFSDFEEQVDEYLNPVDTEEQIYEWLNTDDIKEKKGIYKYAHIEEEKDEYLW